MDLKKKTKISNEIIKEIVNNDTHDLSKIEYDAMGDDDIKFYFPNSKIITYPELKKYKTIEELLPNDKSYVFLLYLNKENSGHWTLLSHNNNCYEFFCSYGSSPSTPLKWLDADKRKELKQDIPYLDFLLSNTKKNVIYNPIDYQNNKDLRVSTCGRHDCFRLMFIIKYNLPLTKYYEIMKNIKEKTNMSYDDIVADFINKM